MFILKNCSLLFLLRCSDYDYFPEKKSPALDFDDIPIGEGDDPNKHRIWCTLVPNGASFGLRVGSQFVCGTVFYKISSQSVPGGVCWGTFKRTFTAYMLLGSVWAFPQISDPSSERAGQCWTCMLTRAVWVSHCCAMQREGAVPCRRARAAAYRGQNFKHFRPLKRHFTGLRRF